MIIIVTGTPGTGKTEIAKTLAKKVKYNYLDVNLLIKEKGLNKRYLKKFDTYEVDVKELNKVLIEVIKENKNLIIDSHLSHYLPKKYVNYCVVCKCEIKELKKRLMKRKYSKLKTRENIDSEIFDVCLVEALENKHKIITVNTSDKNVNSCVKELISKLKL